MKEMEERHEPRDTRSINDSMSERESGSPALLRADIPIHVQRNMMYSYIARHGTKRPDRKCWFDHENLCDIMCPHFKISTAAYIATKGPQRGDYTLLAGCFCTKFMSPHQMEEIKIHPLDKEEDDG